MSVFDITSFDLGAFVSHIEITPEFTTLCVGMLAVILVLKVIT